MSQRYFWFVQGVGDVRGKIICIRGGLQINTPVLIEYKYPAHILL